MSASGAINSSIVLKMRSRSPLFRTSAIRVTVALLAVSWAVDIWFLLRATSMLESLRKVEPAGRGAAPYERCEVADGSEVGQLVGVDDRVDACDLTVGDVERH